MPAFIIVAYVRQISEGVAFVTRLPGAAPKRAMLNKVEGSSRYSKKKLYQQPPIPCIKIHLNERTTHSQLHTDFQVCLILESKFGDDLNVNSTETPISSRQNTGKVLKMSTGLSLFIVYLLTLKDCVDVILLLFRFFPITKIVCTVL